MHCASCALGAVMTSPLHFRRSGTQDYPRAKGCATLPYSFQDLTHTRMIPLFFHLDLLIVFSPPTAERTKAQMHVIMNRPS
jgi:hypothetical protein